MVAAPRIYMDHNAGAPLSRGARDAMMENLARYGNASSIHAEGRTARQVVENAREKLAGVVGCEPAQVIFTSGATEAANFALSPLLREASREIALSSLFLAASEHPCVLAGGRFAADAVHKIGVSADGLLDLDELDERLAAAVPSSGVAMVAVQAANSETGVLQSLEKIAETVRRHGAYLTVDAVQALGKTDFRTDKLDADFVLLSAHKIGGPQGVGALVLGKKQLSPAPLLTGGGQETYHRAGTENVAAIAGFAAALDDLWDEATRAAVMRRRDLIEARISAICIEAGREPAAVFGANAPRLVNTSCFASAGVKAEIALIALDLAGIAASSGSACSSGKVGKSHVLAAMGVDNELARCALRISLGADSNEADTERFAAVWSQIVERAGTEVSRTTV